VPLPGGAGVSWDSGSSFGSSGGPEVVVEQPSSSISPVSVGGIADVLSSYSGMALARDFCVRSAVPRQVNPRQVNPNLPRMSGSFGPNRSMQGVRSDTWQRF